MLRWWFGDVGAAGAEQVEDLVDVAEHLDRRDHP